jgi:hypothetical protein
MKDRKGKKREEEGKTIPSEHNKAIEQEKCMHARGR